MKPLPQENLFLWVKRQEREIDHLSTSNIEVKNLQTVYLVRHKGLACGFTSRIHGLLNDALHNS